MTVQIKQVHYFLMALLLVYVFFLSHSVVRGKALQKTDKQLIVETIKKTISKDVVVTQINGPYVAGNYALSSIIFIEGSSQLVLEKKNGKWEIIGGGGGALEEHGLTEFGVPLKDAQNILKQEEAYWQKKNLK